MQKKYATKKSLCFNFFKLYLLYIPKSHANVCLFYPSFKSMNTCNQMKVSTIILTAPSQPTKVGIVTLQFVTLYQQKHLKHQQQKHVVDSMPGHQTMSSICIYVSNCHSPTQSFNVKYSTNFPFIFNTLKIITTAK